jgi:hypothetical protein
MTVFSSQFNTLTQTLKTSRWFAPEPLLLATLVLSLGFLSIQTIQIHDDNTEPLALLAKAKAQSTIVVAQAQLSTIKN